MYCRWEDKTARKRNDHWSLVLGQKFFSARVEMSWMLARNSVDGVTAFKRKLKKLMGYYAFHHKL